MKDARRIVRITLSSKATEMSEIKGRYWLINVNGYWRYSVTPHGQTHSLYTFAPTPIGYDLNG